ncbi:MAG: DUF3139 domain-containing protein [Oscillospiraceae bacterium]|nr:DUF3139 domain-containing protein [Oscillospiraceae bacterium]
MKRKMILFCLVLCLTAGMTYKAVGSIVVRSKTYAFLEESGYTKADISDVEIKHSFLNKLLSYNEWRIFVTFQKEPDIVFAFTRRNGEILRQGVSSTPMLEKDEILAYKEMFDQGELHIP